MGNSVCGVFTGVFTSASVLLPDSEGFLSDRKQRPVANDDYVSHRPRACTCSKEMPTAFWPP